MGKKDDYQYDYLDDNRRFADQINGALFKGERVVKPEELEPAEPQAVFLGKEAGKEENFKTIVDKTKMWKGKRIHILAIENQNYVDYQMVFRNMMSESLGYHKQWKQKSRRNKSDKDRNKRSKDEFLSEIRKDDKFIPIITLVVYYGKEHPWDGAVCLHDLLDIDDQFKKYVNNYRLNLYDCHKHDTFEEYHTELRQVFEIIRYADDKEKLQKVISENRTAYSSIDGETKALLETVANVRLQEECGRMENGEKKYSLCKAFEDMKLEGKESKLVEQIQKKLVKGKSVDLIAQELEEEGETIRDLIEKWQLNLIAVKPSDFCTK